MFLITRGHNIASHFRVKAYSHRASALTLWKEYIDFNWYVQTEWHWYWHLKMAPQEGGRGVKWHFEIWSPTWKFQICQLFTFRGRGWQGGKWHFEIWSTKVQLDVKLPNLQTFHFWSKGVLVPVWGKVALFGAHYSYMVSPGCFTIVSSRRLNRMKTWNFTWFKLNLRAS